MTVPPVYQAPSNGDGDPNAWLRYGLCHPPPDATAEEIKQMSDVFFPGQGESPAPAKAICARCPVRQPCLEYALDERIKYGIFGGKSERERRRLRSGSKRTLKCFECGRLFQVAPTSGGSLRKTCSDECRVVRHRRSASESHISQRYTS